ncbi:MAG: hypothetical protein KDJ87_04945 [Rhizobiaceae bacterium]|nr:hypothetical protein [Rhizobiaceae bacterium]
MNTAINKVNLGSSEISRPSATERATYIRDTLVEIRRFAEDEELGFLRYLLSMALEEANVSVVTTTKHPGQ